MAKRRRTRRKKQRVTIPLSTWLEVAGIVLLGIALLTVLSLLSFSRGTLTAGWLDLLRAAFGWGAYVLPIGLGAVGFWLFLVGFGRPVRVPFETVAGAVLLFLSGVGLLHYFAGNPAEAALSGRGGGHLGWVISRTLIGALGDLG
ncbi:MAG: hypothetical protein JSW37_08870, partial [Anaerolineales bacterium]